MVSTHPGKRFAFGRNWKRFLGLVDAERIAEAEHSLLQMLARDSLKGMRFLDIGCGSGLFSLAARRLGAHVCSFDYDADSVGCTTELKQRYAPGDDLWTICRGSVLDEQFVTSLGAHDKVYAWGVLHHTGSMQQALSHAALPVAEGGMLFIALYNDQGPVSLLWRSVKQLYCSGLLGKVMTAGIFFPGIILACFVNDICALKNPYRRYKEYKTKRGMSVFYDWIDWLGGYPFETARPDDVIAFFRRKNFSLEKKVLTKGWGNNQFVFKKEKEQAS